MPELVRYNGKGYTNLCVTMITYVCLHYLVIKIIWIIIQKQSVLLAEPPSPLHMLTDLRRSRTLYGLVYMPIVNNQVPTFRPCDSDSQLLWVDSILETCPGGCHCLYLGRCYTVYQCVPRIDRYNWQVKYGIPTTSTIKWIIISVINM